MTDVENSDLEAARLAIEKKQSLYKYIDNGVLSVSVCLRDKKVLIYSTKNHCLPKEVKVGQKTVPVEVVFVEVV